MAVDTIDFGTLDYEKAVRQVEAVLRAWHDPHGSLVDDAFRVEAEEILGNLPLAAA